MTALSELRAACLPFVTRSLRGARLRRLGVLSAVLTVVALVAGLWLAQDRNSLAREVRQDVGLEQYLGDRQRAEFVLLATDRWQHDVLEHQRAAIVNGQASLERLSEHHVVRSLANEAWIAASWAARGEGAAARLDPALRQRAADLVARRFDLALFAAEITPEPYQRDPAFIARVVDHGLVPPVQSYASPLSTADTVRVLGLISGGVLGVLLLLVAPLLVGAQMATEVHENTLQPLTGTALSTRQLLLGMAAGPLAVVALLAAPHAAVFAAAALTAGRVLTALGFFAALGCASVMLVMLAQLVAAGLGKRRTPGMISVSVLVGIGGLGMIGLLIGFDVSRDSIGVTATVPSAAAVHLWHATFMPIEWLSASSALALDLRIVAASAGFLALAVVSHLAIERRISGRPGALLQRSEAALGAFVLVALALMAVPPSIDQFAEVYLATLAIALVPLQFLVMARVPVGDVPPSMRALPLSRILAEYAVVLLVHLAAVAVLADAPRLDHLAPGGVLHLLWALLVAALVSVRGVATPVSLAAKVWLGVCLVCAMVEFGMGAALSADGGNRHVWFPPEHADPIAALVYIGLFLSVPASLGRALVRSGLRLR